MPVPSASESGRLRLGFFTSAAVKVTLFQASIGEKRAHHGHADQRDRADHPRGVVGG